MSTSPASTMMAPSPEDRLVRPQRDVALRLFRQIGFIAFVISLLMMAFGAAKADQLLSGAVLLRSLGYAVLIVGAVAASFAPFYWLEAKRWIRWNDHRLIVVTCGQEV